MSSGGGSGLLGLSTIEGWLHGAHESGGFSPNGKLLMLLGAVMNFAFFVISPHQMLVNLAFVLFLSPLFLPILLGTWAVETFIMERKAAYILGQPTVLLEILLPRDVRKGPLAMETVISSLSLASGEGTWYKRNILGRSRPWWTFELVSLGGRVHFYAWTRQQFRRPLETFLYAQYPGVQIIEATDYSRLIDPSHAHGYKMGGWEYEHTNPIQAYPIKTYVDFGLDKTPFPKPEEQTDPMAQMLETLGSIGPKEQMWIQICWRANKYEKYRGKKTSTGKKYGWKQEAKEEVERIREELTTKSTYVDSSGNLVETKGFPNPTEMQKERMKALERNSGKLGYDVGIRTLYFAPKDVYERSMGSLSANMFKPFNSEIFNGIMPNSRFSEHFNDYPWEDPTGEHERHAMHLLVDAYRRRSFFHPPYRGEWMIMSSEELATIFHIPSGTVTTPSLERIQSSSSEAPANLPT